MSRLSPEAERFREVARRFCGVIDDAGNVDRLAFLESTSASLAELYHAGSELSVRRLSDQEVPDSLTEGWVPSYEEVAGPLRAVLAADDIYWQLFSPTPDDPPIQQFLSDDLTNVYRDVLEGLIALDAGAFVGDVEGEWRISFTSHWGPHAVKALRTVHYLLYAS